MSVWKKYELRELCSDIIDCVNKTAPISEVPTKYRMLRTSDIRGGKVNLDNLNCVSKETYDKWTRRGKLQVGDIVFTREAPLGEVGLIRTSAENLFLGQRLVLFRANRDVCDNRFLLYSLLFRDNKQAIIQKGVGSTVLHLRVPECERITIHAPKLTVQHRIADILSAYDDLIENNQKQIKLLEEAAQRLYKEWFVDLHFPGYEHTKIVDGVPEGWEEKSISSISSILRRGISPKYNDQGNYTVINQKCIRQTVVSFDEARKQEKIYPEELNLQDSDTVICSTGAGTLGRVGQVFGNYDNTTFDSHVTLIRANKEIGKQYLFQSLKFNQSYFTDMGKGSTNQLELNRETIQNLAVFIPTKDIINRFELLAQASHDKITMLSNEIIRLQEVRDCLLPKLMSGEMKI